MSKLNIPALSAPSTAFGVDRTNQVSPLRRLLVTKASDGKGRPTSRTGHVGACLTLASLVLLGTLGTSVSEAADQEALLKVKALYASAAYEDALAVIARLPAESGVPELDQYQVFCLFALGNQEEARAVLEKLLTKDPLYAPNAADTPPRVMEEFRDLRRQLLPGLARETYVEAKAAMERKDRAAAIAGFEKVVRIASSADAADAAESLADLKVLADGFLDLSRLLPEPVTEPAEPAQRPARTDTAAAAGNDAAVFERPVALSQAMPPWKAPDSLTRRTEFNGAIRVVVGTDGKVISTEMVRSIHPIYDRVLMEAAQDWTYKPAKRNGQPVASDVLVQVQLRPE